MEELAQESRWKGRVPAWGTGTLRGGRREQAHDGGLGGPAQGVEAVTEGATERYQAAWTPEFSGWAQRRPRGFGLGIGIW